MPVHLAQMNALAVDDLTTSDRGSEIWRFCGGKIRSAIRVHAT